MKRSHVGNVRPVPPDTPVIIYLGDDDTDKWLGWAKDFAWGPGADGMGRIVSYEVLAPVAVVAEPLRVAA